MIVGRQPDSFDVVIPTAGRPSLARLLAALQTGAGPAPGRIVVVDDRRGAGPPLAVPRGVEVVRGPGRGPAAARNTGWRATSAEWVAFLDDDVISPPSWRAALARDLAAAAPELAGSQGRIVVPLPAERRPTDWERSVHGLERAQWATADMAFRRSALTLVGGFDERFPRAYREDADLALRLLEAGLRLSRGRRHVVHPVREAGPWVSLRRQAGNADDALMDALHGPDWRVRAGAPRGRLHRHGLSTAALAGALTAGRRAPRLAGALAGVWAALSAEFALARIAPGPRSTAEVARMLLTSAGLPPLAVYQRLRGEMRARALKAGRRRATPAGPAADPRALPPLAVLLDRDDTLIEDVPYNGDPALVRPLPGAGAALARLRSAGCRLAIVSNQSGIGRGLISPEQVAAVNARVQELLGPFDACLICPHAPEEACECRKPAPGLVLAAARRLGVSPVRCAVLGDIGADVEAARAAGARGVLIPSARTRPEELARAPERAATLAAAAELLLGGRGGEERGAA